MRDIVDFTRQLATMVKARLSLTQILEILAKQQSNTRFQCIIQNILRQVESGKPLSDSLKAYPKLFGPLYVNILTVGEVSGKMDEVLDQLATYLEKMNGLKRKITTAMTYPIVIILVAIGAVSFLVFGVMPTFSDMFEDFNAQMPLPAKILMEISNFMASNWLIIIVCLIIMIGLFRVYGRTPKGRWGLDKIKLKLPIVGKVIQKAILARFTGTLGTLLSSGVSLLDALEVTAKSSGNLIIQKQILNMKETAAKGEPMEKSLTDPKLFPELVTQMIAVGEETAELPYMLVKISEYYENEVDTAVESLTSIIEPIIIVVLGIILGGTMIAIYLQIFDLMEVIQ